ncbi:hypothetical protein GF391_02450 [Candidatus Uhrbacteria bacterium]|nr:hypothetical protein [Candidatus Uhrbacteria bacterium]
MTSSSQKPTPASAPKAPVKPAAAPAAKKPPPGKVGLPSTGIKADPPAKKPAVKPKAETKIEQQEPVTPPADYGFLGNVSLKDAIALIASQIGYAFALTIGILIAIEWLMPGSVLPFINIISLLPLSFTIVVLLFAFRGRKSGILNALNIVVGIIITIALLASMLTNMPLYALRTILLAGSAALIIAVWAVSMYTEH